jgi:hypothetical protein
MMMALCDKLRPPADSARKMSGSANPPSANPPIFRKCRRDCRSQKEEGLRPKMESMNNFLYLDWTHQAYQFADDDALAVACSCVLNPLHQPWHCVTLVEQVHGAAVVVGDRPAGIDAQVLLAWKALQSQVYKRCNVTGENSGRRTISLSARSTEVTRKVSR